MEELKDIQGMQSFTTLAGHISQNSRNLQSQEHVRINLFIEFFSFYKYWLFESIKYNTTQHNICVNTNNRN